MKIWLDDLRDAPDESWTVIRRAYPCILRLANAGWNHDPLVDEISLDHDLGDEAENGSGYDVLKWLERQAYDGIWEVIPEKISIHSDNPVGRKNMQAAIDSIERMRNAN